MDDVDYSIATVPIDLPTIRRTMEFLTECGAEIVVKREYFPVSDWWREVHDMSMRLDPGQVALWVRDKKAFFADALGIEVSTIDAWEAWRAADTPCRGTTKKGKTCAGCGIGTGAVESPLYFIPGFTDRCRLHEIHDPSIWRQWDYHGAQIEAAFVGWVGRSAHLLDRRHHAVEIYETHLSEADRSWLET